MASVNVSENKIEYEENGKIMAEILFIIQSDGIVDICHTQVDESLRGKGVAGRLMERAAIELRLTHRKAIPTCSYAIKWFTEHPEFDDVLIYTKRSFLDQTSR
jgi:uncharacterized protein